MSIEYASFASGQRANYWTLDPVLQGEITRTVDADIASDVVARLKAFGALVGETISANADTVDTNGPVLHTYDRDGALVNEVEYHPAHLENEQLVYEAGIVADSFRSATNDEPRFPLLSTLAATYLLSYADIGLACPVAMTTGAALVLEAFDDGTNQAYLNGLVTRDYNDLLHGAMFLTERQGGSDVGATETIAEPVDRDIYSLQGEKWFCSKVDAGVILTLSRRPGAPAGTAGLSLFLVPRRTRDGQQNHLIVRRLKDKLGTVSVPTGEVEFDETEAYLVGEPERGFRYMAEMLNYERVANAFAACGAMGRALLESKVRAAHRETFGQRLDEHPLMRRDLMELAVTHEAATAITFDAGAAYHASIREHDQGSFQLMRALVPIVKHRTARLAVDVASYAMEIHGGNGYVADWVTHRLLRDVQVLPIWEGTSNVLSLDLLRAMDAEAAHEAVLTRIQEYLAVVDAAALDDHCATVETSLRELDRVFTTIAEGCQADAEFHAKALADLVFDVYASALLLAEASDALEAGDGRKALVAHEFIMTRLRPPRDRAITSDDRPTAQAFDAIVRFADADPSVVGLVPPPD